MARGGERKSFASWEQLHHCPCIIGGLQPRATRCHAVLPCCAGVGEAADHRWSQKAELASV